MNPYITYAFTQIVWTEVEGIVGSRDVWQGNTVEERLENWMEKRDLKSFRTLPFVVSRGCSS